MASGIGIGAFAQGLSSGLRTGALMAKRIDKNRKRDAIGNVFEDARGDYDAMIQGKVDAQAADVPGVDFNRKRYAAKVKKQNPFSDYFFGTKLPQATTSLMEAGDFETAKMLRTWGEDKDTRQYLKNFGTLLGTAQTGFATGDFGDYFGAVKSLVNEGDYGATIQQINPIRNGEGVVTGAEVRYKDDDKGKRYTRQFSIDDLTRSTVNMFAPERNAVAYLAKQQAAIDAKAGIAETAGKARIKLNADLVRDRLGYRQDRALNEQEAGLKSGRKTNELRSQTRFKIQSLRKAGFTDDQINRLTPQILGVASTTNVMSPQEQLQWAMKTLNKGDVYGEGFTKLPAKQKVAKAKALVRAMNESAPGITGGRATGSQGRATGVPVY